MRIFATLPSLALLLSTAAPTLAWVQPAWAQQAPASPAHDSANATASTESRNDTFGIVGFGAVLIPDYEGSNDYHITAAPGAIGRIAGVDFQLVGNRINLDLVRDRGGPGWKVIAGPMGVVNLNRTSVHGIDDPRVAALGEVDTAIELGAYAGVTRVGVVTSDYDRLSFTLTYRHDVTGVHDSAVVTPTLSYSTPISPRSVFALYVSADHVGDGYARTYFGVTPDGAVASGLPVYTPDGGWKNWGFGAGGSYALVGTLTGGLQLVGGIGYRRLIGDFADSPLTQRGSADQWLGAIGLGFNF